MACRSVPPMNAKKYGDKMKDIAVLLYGGGNFRMGYFVMVQATVMISLLIYALSASASWLSGLSTGFLRNRNMTKAIARNAAATRYAPLYEFV